MAAHEGSDGGKGSAAAGPAQRRGPVPSLAELPTDPGLCARCVHLRLVRSLRSTFLRCGKADDAPSFPRYPRLPVVACAGFLPSA